MSVTVAILSVLVALGIGALVGWLYASRQTAGAKETVQSLRLQLTGVVAERDGAREEVKALAKSMADLSSELSAFRAAEEVRVEGYEKQIVALNEIQDGMKAQFAEVSSQLLSEVKQQFLKRADERFNEAGQKTELKIQSLLKPMKDTLERYEKDLRQFDEKREGAFGALQQAVIQLLGENEKTRRETQRLANVMVSSPKARGRWGEEQLRTILESAGLRDGIDFFAQKTVEDDDKHLRPDFVIRLPGNRTIIVDVKCPLVAFEQAYEEEDESKKADLLKQHAKALRTYAGELGKKGYAAKFNESPDFVVMFVPGEHHLSAAAERDLGLIEEAFRNGVIVASTINMLALSKFMAGLWKQEALNRKAQEIASLGRELHQRLATMTEHIANLGTHIGRAGRSYNSMIGSLDRNVLTQARKFEELGAAGTKALPDLLPVDVEILHSAKLSGPPKPSNEDDAAA